MIDEAKKHGAGWGSRKVCSEWEKEKEIEPSFMCRFIPQMR